MKELTQTHKAKEPERTVIKASWGIYVAGTDKNYLEGRALGVQHGPLGSQTYL